MQRIILDRILPAVFADAPVGESQIWQQNVVLEKGRTHLLEAHSGKGKSTLLSYMMGYRDDYQGAIRFDERDARTLGREQWTAIRSCELGIMFQELRLFGELTARENIDLKNRLTGYATDRKINELFDCLGIADKRDTPIRKMSFGQQQRVALIRALVQPFDFLLLDEPISHLDASNAEVMAQIVKEEARTRGAGVIATSIGNTLPLDYNTILKL